MESQILCCLFGAEFTYWIPFDSWALAKPTRLLQCRLTEADCYTLDETRYFNIVSRKSWKAKRLSGGADATHAEAAAINAVVAGSIPGPEAFAGCLPLIPVQIVLSKGQ